MLCGVFKVAGKQIRLGGGPAAGRLSGLGTHVSGHCSVILVIGLDLEEVCFFLPMLSVLIICPGAKPPIRPCTKSDAVAITVSSNP